MKSKIAFLDRDGVINSSRPNNGYVGSLKHFKWVPGAIKAIKFLNEKNYKVVVVTNQSGVARGFFSIKDVKKIHSHIQKKLKENEARIDKFYFCPFHKDGIVKKYKKNSLLRKPNIGMFLSAKKIWNIDKKNSFMIGDQKTDLQFAKKCKIKGYFFNQNNLYKFIKTKIFKKDFKYFFKKKINKCRLCLSKNLIKKINMPASEPANNFRSKKNFKLKLPRVNLDLYQCKNCGHAQILNTVNPVFSWTKQIYKSASSPDLKDHFNEYSKYLVKQKYIKKNQTILDIGSNDGIFLDFLKKKGILTYGIDPLEKVNFIAKNKGHTIVSDFFNIASVKKIQKKFSKKFDLVTANNVFAHTDNLNLMLQNISKLLKQKSFFIFEASYLLDTLKNRVIDFIYDEHLSYHSIKPLKEFLKKENLFIYDILRIKTKGGSIRVICGKDKKLENIKLIKTYILKEQKYGLYKNQIYKKINKEIATSKKIIHNWIKKIKKLNPEIKLYGYGAYQSGTILLRMLNLEKYLTGLFDDNKEKIKKIAPNSLLEVLPLSEVRKNNKIVIFILAWRYKKVILHKLRKLSNNNIIICLKPNLKTIKNLI